MGRTILGILIVCVAVAVAFLVIMTMPVTVTSATFVASMPDAMGSTQSVDVRPVVSVLANICLALALVVVGCLCASAVLPKPRESAEHRLPGCV